MFKRNKRFFQLLSAVVLLFGSALAHGADPQMGEMQVDKAALKKRFGQRPYSPWAESGFPRQIYWGDTHLHTDLSVDAGLFGARVGLEEAYRFARGEEVTSASGIPAWPWRRW